MSIIFSDNFDAGLSAGWSNIPSISVPFGGAGYGTGVGITGKKFIACNSGAANTNHSFTAIPAISVRSMMAFKAPSSSSTWEFFYVADSGGVFILILKGNGQISIRRNDVRSETLGPSALGVFLADGTAFALQWHITQNSSTSINVVVDINNIQVWTHTYTSTDNIDGNDKWPGGAGPNFTSITLLPGANGAIDNLEIDNSASSVSYSIDPNFTALGAEVVHSVVTSLVLTVGSPNFTLTGSNFRIPDPAFILIFIKGPDGIEHNSLGSGITIVTATSTSVVGTIDFPITAGSWCAKFFNSANCWETPFDPIYSCFDIGPPELSGIYLLTTSNKTHDIYNTAEMKIPDPTIKTGLVGE